MGIPGVRVWSFAGHGLNLVWFHVSVQREDVEYGRVIFASSLAQVLQLKEQCGAESLDVLLVSPPYVNGTEHWRMELLREAWIAPESGNTVYIVHGRRHYSDDPDQQALGTSLMKGYPPRKSGGPIAGNRVVPNSGNRAVPFPGNQVVPVRGYFPPSPTKATH